MPDEPDVSEFLALSHPKTTHCPMKNAIEKLSSKERRELHAALAHDSGIITNVAISLWLADRGLTCKWQNVTSHRKGTCSCR